MVREEGLAEVTTMQTREVRKQVPQVSPDIVQADGCGEALMSGLFGGWWDGTW